MAQKLNHAQQVAYEEATAADKRWRQVKLEAHAEAQKIVDEMIQQAATARDVAVRRAYDKGVRKAFFRKKEGGLHTTNQDEINKILARTEHLAELHAEAAEAAAEAAGMARYAVDADGYLWITPPADQLATVVAEVNANPMAAFEPDTVIPESARFERTRFGKLNPIDGATIPGTYDRNPVVMWLARDSHEADALAWLSDEQTARAAA